MKYFFQILLLFSIVSTTACLDDYNKSSKYPIKHAHDYDDHDHEGHDHSHSSVDIILGENENIYASKNRNAWQKSEVIRFHLGPQKGKVVADIGAGPYGYFTFDFATSTTFDKILALDIDQAALDFIDKEKTKLNLEASNKIETRLVDPEDPKLQTEEVDVVLIANTLIYIEDRLAYLANLKKGIKKNGRLVIVDYKMKSIPSFFPPKEERMPLYKMEALVEEAGFSRVISDDFSLPYQYVVVCDNN